MKNSSLFLLLKIYQTKSKSTSSAIHSILISLRHDVLHADYSEIQDQWIGQTEGQSGRGETEDDESSGVKEHLQEGDDWETAKELHHGLR